MQLRYYSYRTVLVKLSLLTKGCLSLMHTFAVISAAIVINHNLLRLDWTYF